MSWDGLGRWSTTYGRNGRLAFVELAAPCERSTYQYCPQRAEQAELRKRIKEIAETRVRYGYRRIHVLLRREGWIRNGSTGYIGRWACNCGTKRRSGG